MANPKHLEILKRDVKEWNQWREAHQGIKPDFSEADLSGAFLSMADFSMADLRKADLGMATITGANLTGANLTGVDLSGADLTDAYLIGADLTEAKLNYANLDRARLGTAKLVGAKLVLAKLVGANLTGANLVGANLSGADLSGAKLGGTDLSRADLTEAYLSGVDLTEAYLIGADLTEAKLNYANLNGAKLSGAKLTETSLIGADLSGAVLSGANLCWADLNGAKLNGAKLSGTNLSGVKLSGAVLSGAVLSGTNLRNATLLTSRLINANFDGADLTKACLWETQRAGWSIKGVICDSIYWDENGEEESFYGPGEFERLFADKTKVKLFYKDGINPLEIATLPALIKHLEDSRPGCGLRLVSIHEDAGGVVVELAVEGDDNSPEQLKQLITEIETTAQRAIEFERKFLAEEKQRLQLEGALKQSDAIIDKLILRPSVNFQGDYKHMGSTYNVPGQAGAVGDNASASNMTFNQIVNHFQQSIDLQALATQLAELRQAMSEKQGSSPQSAIALGKVAEAEIAAQEKNPSQVMMSLKAAGEWTLDFAKEIGKDVVVEAIKQSMGMP